MDDELKKLSAYCGGLAGKTILDVGTDFQGAFVREISVNFPLKSIEGIGFDVQETNISPNVRLSIKDIRQTDFPDKHFDLVISRSAFEHIQELPKALDEIRRILKPGGIMWTRFGPIWSCSYGHHLWINHKGKDYTYWNLILPPYCHLLMLPQELFGLISPKYGEALGQKIISWIYDSDGQNRLFYEDYEEIFEKCGMEILIMSGTDNPKLENIYGVSVEPSIFQRLRNKYPRYKNFYGKDIFAVLKKVRD